MKTQTNVEFLTELMEYSKNGVLMQAFVLGALETYAKTIQELPEENWNTEMLSLESWKSCAEEALTALKNRK